MLFVPRAQRIAPQTAIDGKFSIPFVFASVMEVGDLTLASFTPERLHAPELLSLARRVTMSDEPVPVRREAIYTIQTGTGDVLSEIVDAVPVWRTRDISLADLAPKLETCTNLGSQPPRAPDLLAALERLEFQPIASLMRLL